MTMPWPSQVQAWNVSATANGGSLTTSNLLVERHIGRRCQHDVRLQRLLVSDATTEHVHGHRQWPIGSVRGFCRRRHSLADTNAIANVGDANTYPNANHGNADPNTHDRVANPNTHTDAHDRVANLTPTATGSTPPNSPDAPAPPQARRPSATTRFGQRNGRNYQVSQIPPRS